MVIGHGEDLSFPHSRQEDMSLRRNHIGARLPRLILQLPMPQAIGSVFKHHVAMETCFPLADGCWREDLSVMSSEDKSCLVISR